MFWFGLGITLLSGLLQINIFREAFKRRFRWMRDHHIDYLAFTFFVGGLSVSAVDHIFTERQAENDRLARKSIEQQLAPRFLNEKQQQLIANKIRQYAPQPFEVLFYLEDKEVIELAKMIAQPLHTAGWRGIKSTTFLAFGLVTGVNVEYPKSELKAAADALSIVLNEEGIAASASFNQKDTRNTSRIRIRVGKKP